MRETTVSRRTFLKGSAATAALACAAGSISLGSWQAERAAAAEPAVTATAPSLCNGCSSKCGLIATTVDGQLWTLKGNEVHPYSKGRICGRGHGLAQMAYSDERVTQPLRRKDDGTFEPIDWDTAFKEIGAKVQDIIAKNGPESLAIIQDPRPSGKQYSARFMNALGSANVYAHSSSCNLSKESAYQLTIGATGYSNDFANAKMVMFIGRSYGDGIRPSSVQSLADAAEHGTRVVIVDPRLNNSGIFASDWVPINPGTDLALLMAMANVLIEEDLYDHDFVEQNTYGFEEFAEQAKEYTPEWAEKITDVPAETIQELARSMAKAAPAASIESGWRSVIGCSYKNSFETARAITAINSLLGCWGAKGGALITSSPKAGAIEDARFKAPAKPAAKRIGDAEYPLVLASAGTNVAALQATLEGEIKGLFFYNSNAAKGYAQPKKWTEALEKTDLVVTIDVQMAETALASDYVLPECTYLERMELPEFIGGKKHYVAMRTQVLEPIHPETKPCDEIFAGLAEACGVGEYFQFSVDELADAQLQTVGLSLEALKKTGTAHFPEKEFSYGSTPKWKTPTEKVQFASEACEKAGLSPYPVWVEPAVMPMGDELRLIGGKQAIHSHTQTANIEDLMQITKDYDLTRVWMNADTAARRGIADGDEVEVSNGQHTGRVRVRVTQRINPTALYMPSHYGCSSPDQHTAYEVGLRQMDYVPFRMEPGYGSACTQETVVNVKKAGA